MYIDASQCILIFLSKGYFYSVNCNRELVATITSKLPVCLVHEADADKGGATLEALKEECRPEYQEAVFNGPRPAPTIWHRVLEFQLTSLKSIAAQTLHATTTYEDEIPNLYMRGEITSIPTGFDQEVVLFCSSANPGARAMGDELSRALSGKKLLITTAVPPSLSSQGAKTATRFQDILDIAELLRDDLDNAPAEQRVQSRGEPAETGLAATSKKKASSWAKVRASAMSSPDASTPDVAATHMLLYLRSDTFVGLAGVRLARQVRLARRQGFPIVMLHENDVARGGCIFGRFFQTTPSDLIADGLYKTIATAMHSGPHREVSHALAARALGAKPLSEDGITTQSAKTFTLLASNSLQRAKSIRNVDLSVIRGRVGAAQGGSMGRIRSRQRKLPTVQVSASASAIVQGPASTERTRPSTTTPTAAGATTRASQASSAAVSHAEGGSAVEASTPAAEGARWPSNLYALGDTHESWV